MSRRIVITSKDYDHLHKLVNHEREFGKEKNKNYLKDLEQELNLANIVPSEKIPSNVITMNSRILLKDIDSGEEMTYTLVYPEDADLLNGKLSILAPIGTAILGFHVGNVIKWKGPAGIVKLKVEKIIYQPEADGNYEL